VLSRLVFHDFQEKINFFSRKNQFFKRKTGFSFKENGLSLCFLFKKMGFSFQENKKTPRDMHLSPAVFLQKTG
jgi:hypothetical protein